MSRDRIVECVHAAVSARVHELSPNQARAELRRLGQAPEPGLERYPHTQLANLIADLSREADGPNAFNETGGLWERLERRLELADELPGARLELDGAAWVRLPGDGPEWFATPRAEVAAWKLWHKLAPLLDSRGEILEISVEGGVALFESRGAPRYEGFRAAICPESGEIAHVGEQSSPELPAPCYDQAWWTSGTVEDAVAGVIPFDHAAIADMAAQAAHCRASLAYGVEFAGSESWEADAVLLEGAVQEALEELRRAGERYRALPDA